MRWPKCITHVLLAYLLLCPSATAVEMANNPLQTGRVRAGLFISPPYIMAENYGGYTGLAIDLWETVAKGLDVKNEYKVYPTVGDLLEAAKTDEIDIVVLDIAVTYDRSAYLRYSFPWFDSGLRIMTHSDSSHSFWSEMVRFRHFRVYLAFSLIFALMALGMTILRRRVDPKYPSDGKTGFTQSLLDVVSSVKSGKLDQAYLGWVGSLISVAWMVFGVAVAAYITSSITSVMTNVALSRSDISSLAELTDKRIGAMRSSVSEEFLSDMAMNVIGYDNLDAAAHALAVKEVDAVVSDTMVLHHFVKTHPEMPLVVVGDIFQQEKYGFVTGLHHREFMERVSEELIWLHETEKIQALRKMYTDDI